MMASVLTHPILDLRFPSRLAENPEKSPLGSARLPDLVISSGYLPCFGLDLAIQESNLRAMCVQFGLFLFSPANCQKPALPADIEFVGLYFYGQLQWNEKGLK
jgi:hypothetical protein